MAVTRATGKAYRLAFSWVMTLAGYQPTPAEEMDLVQPEPRDVTPARHAPQAPAHRLPPAPDDGPKISDKQKRLIYARGAARAETLGVQIVDVLRPILDDLGYATRDDIPRSRMDVVLNAIDTFTPERAQQSAEEGPF